MINRRDLILGGACIGAGAGAYALRPRKRLSLAGNVKLAGIVPVSFDGWESQTSDGLVRPETEGKLASLLYSEIVSRVYARPDTNQEVMLLIAYGDNQSDLLQLHRPESCYPAVGFKITRSETTTLMLRPDVGLPMRRVVAERSDRRESILYWTRLGEYLPTGAGEQRAARLRTAMQGFIPDGGLFRLSKVGEPDEDFRTLEAFAVEMVMATPAKSRLALVGSSIARQLA